MKTAPFYKTAHNRCDRVGKAAIAAYLEQEGYMDVQINPDAYGIDILAVNPNGIREYHEVGMKEQWFRTWPNAYKTCNVAGRKKHYLTEFPLRQLFFWEVSNHLDKARRITGTVAKKYGATPHENWRASKANMDYELMFQLPLKSCPVVSIKVHHARYAKWLRRAKVLHNESKK